MDCRLWGIISHGKLLPGNGEHQRMFHTNQSWKQINDEYDFDGRQEGPNHTGEWYCRHGPKGLQVLSGSESEPVCDLETLAERAEIIKLWDIPEACKRERTNDF